MRMKVYNARLHDVQSSVLVTRTVLTPVSSFPDITMFAFKSFKVVLAVLASALYIHSATAFEGDGMFHKGLMVKDAILIEPCLSNVVL